MVRYVWQFVSREYAGQTCASVHVFVCMRFFSVNLRTIHAVPVLGAKIYTQVHASVHAHLRVLRYIHKCMHQFMHVYTPVCITTPVIHVTSAYNHLMQLRKHITIWFVFTATGASYTNPHAKTTLPEHTKNNCCSVRFMREQGI